MFNTDIGTSLCFHGLKKKRGNIWREVNWIPNLALRQKPLQKTTHSISKWEKVLQYLIRTDYCGMNCPGTDARTNRWVPKGQWPPFSYKWRRLMFWNVNFENFPCRRKSDLKHFRRMLSPVAYHSLLGGMGVNRPQMCSVYIHKMWLEKIILLRNKIWRGIPYC